MRGNIADNILARVNKTVGNVANRLSRQYKGVKPFDKEPVRSEDQLYWYEQLGIEDINALIEKHGREKVNYFIFESEQIKQRRSKK